MNTNNRDFNPAFYEAYKNPSHGIPLMKLEDFKWMAEVKPHWDDWIASACYSKRAYLMEKLGDHYLHNIWCINHWTHASEDDKVKLTEINQYIVTFLGYVPTKREPLPWH